MTEIETKWTKIATAALVASSDWVGYGLYLDLAEDLCHGEQQHRFPLGGEEARVRHAIELAKEGKEVLAVVQSF